MSLDFKDIFDIDVSNKKSNKAPKKKKKGDDDNDAVIDALLNKLMEQKKKPKPRKKREFKSEETKNKMTDVLKKAREKSMQVRAKQPNEEVKKADVKPSTNSIPTIEKNYKDEYVQSLKIIDEQNKKINQFAEHFKKINSQNQVQKKESKPEPKPEPKHEPKHEQKHDPFWYKNLL